MASPAPNRILPAIFLLFILSIGAQARPGVHFHPCKTVFISYTISSTSSLDSNPTVQVSQISSAASSDQDPRWFFAVYRNIHPSRYAALPFLTTDSAAAAHSHPIRPVVHRRPIPYHEHTLSFGVSSLRDRAKDILVVVAGLLFGVGCGALMSATMYLAWSLIANRHEFCGFDGYDFDGEEIESPRKMGYASLLPAPASPVSPVKEGYEGN